MLLKRRPHNAVDHCTHKSTNNDEHNLIIIESCIVSCDDPNDGGTQNAVNRPESTDTAIIASMDFSER